MFENIGILNFKFGWFEVVDVSFRVVFDVFYDVDDLIGIVWYF